MIKDKRILLLAVLILLLGVNFGCSVRTSSTTLKKIKIGVSIVPLKGFVNAVGGDRVEVAVAIPPGFSPESYQPSPSDMKGLSQGELFFAIGVPAEIGFIESIEKNNSINVVQLNERIAEYYPLRYFNEIQELNKEPEQHNRLGISSENNEKSAILADDHDHEHEHAGADPHIWLSPKRAIAMVETIRDELIAIDQVNKGLYNKNANKYINELINLDKYIKEIVDKLENKAFIIYHPSLGYFADDYGLSMISIEEGGKGATIESLKKVIDIAKEKQIRTVYYQQEFDSKQAMVIAKEIGGHVASLNLLEEDYIINMKYLVDSLNVK